ncbi:MAG: methyltransferase domain-containing protein, partial [Bryobacteraceae bacterium]
MPHTHYIIRGGVEGRDRLRILSRLMAPSTHAVLLRAGLSPGMSCFEIGCGSGHLAFDMAQIVGPFGKVLGTDIDELKLTLAAEEAATLGLKNIEFRMADIMADPGSDAPCQFDL